MGTGAVVKLKNNTGGGDPPALGKSFGPASVEEEFEFERAAEDESDLIILKARQMAKDQEEFSAAMERTHQAIGRVQIGTLAARQLSLQSLVDLRRLKESGEYKKAGKTWATCCREGGWNRRNADRLIENLRPLALEFLDNLSNFRFSTIEAKRIAMLGTSVQLRDASKLDKLSNSEAAIIIDEREVPFDEIHREEILTIVDEALSKREKEAKKAEKELKEANKEHETEKKSLLKEIERLKPFDPEDKGLDRSLKQMEEIEKGFNEWENGLRRFCFDKRLDTHPEIQARIEAIQVRVRERWLMFCEDWDAFANAETE